MIDKTKSSGTSGQKPSARRTGLEQKAGLSLCLIREK